MRSSASYYHLDRIGSPIMITDESGNVVKEKKYEAFGNLIWAEGTHDDNREFTGKEKEPTGFHYFGARRYYGNIGRFLTPDPHTVNPGNIDLSNPQELNPYVYCVNNPLKFYDPDGKAYFAVKFNKLLNPYQVRSLAMETTRSLLKGEKVIGMPYYYKRSLIGDIKTRGFFSAITNLGSYGLESGKEYIGASGQRYKAFLTAVGTGESWTEGMTLSVHLTKLEKTKSGEQLLELSVGGLRSKDKKVLDKSDKLIQYIGTVEDLNQRFEPHGFQIYKYGTGDGYYGIREYDDGKFNMVK